MRVAYFDCSSGISGNMVLGALINAGLKRTYLLKELGKLGLKGFRINVSDDGISTHVDVALTERERKRSLKDIFKIIDSSRLSGPIKRRSKEIFTLLAEAESKVHGEPFSKLHFHELGQTDAIIDIVGTVIGLEKLKIKKAYSSPLNIGRGRITMDHGTFAVPAPATSVLIRGIPVFTNELEGELTTPTGAAIITSIASFGDMPVVRFEKCGRGRGSYRLKRPNILSVTIGESENLTLEDSLLKIEADIDDMNPEFFDHLIKKLLGSGAVDARVTQCRMKKGRPGAALQALCKVADKDRMASIIFRETSSFGLRISLVKRVKLGRKIEKIRTKYGTIRVKTGFLRGEAVGSKPEYSDCAGAAARHKVPLRLVHLEALKELARAGHGPR